MTDEPGPPPRSSMRTFLRSLGEIGRAVRDGVHEVKSAARENRGVVRSSCAALEGLARRSIWIVGNFRSQVVARWERVPFVGAVIAALATTVTRLVAGVLSMVATLMMVCDILLNTARTERLG